MFAIIGLIPPWLAARRLGLQTVLAGSLSAGAVSITRKRLTFKSSISTSPRCTLRRSARKIDSRAMASAPMAKAPTASAPAASATMATAGCAPAAIPTRVAVNLASLLCRPSQTDPRLNTACRPKAARPARPLKKKPQTPHEPGLPRMVVRLHDGGTSGKQLAEPSNKKTRNSDMCSNKMKKPRAGKPGLLYAGTN